MYLRTYPEWAISKEEAVRRAICLDNRVICEVVAQMAQHLEAKEATKLLSVIKPAKCQVIVEPIHELCCSILKMDKEKETF